MITKLIRPFIVVRFMFHSMFENKFFPVFESSYKWKELTEAEQVSPDRKVTCSIFLKFDTNSEI